MHGDVSAGVRADARRDNFSAQGRSNAERREAGARFESHALVFLQRQRLVLVARNVQCRGGEIDLVWAGTSSSACCTPRGTTWRASRCVRTDGKRRRRHAASTW
jgi:Holliday junction resolvase-like predicted endonuclease